MSAAILEGRSSMERTVASELGATAARLRLPGLALTLEGGYDLVALRASTAATVRGLIQGRGGA